MTALDAGFDISRATGYRYRDEVVTVLSAQAPDLHEALEQVAETTVSTKGETINAWYSGKHRAHGGNVQAVVRPDGQPIWISDGAPGHRHDLTVARNAEVVATLNWAASALNLPTLADSGYDGAGEGIKTPIKQPADGQVLAVDNQAYNALHRATRCRGERGFALLTRRWRVLRRVTVSPRRIGEIAQASLVLTQIENVALRHSC
jgi:DDE superfamily endonuclease